MNEAFPYDAIETDDAVCLVVVCEAPPARTVETRLVQGRGIELSCGRWLMRVTNLHPRLEEACRAKPVSVAAVDRAGLVVRGPAGLQGPIWRESAFYWYLDPKQSTAETLARRPFPRAVALGGRAVVVAALGSLPYGPPVALCASAPILTALPPSRLWHRVCNGLLVDQSLLDASPPGHPAGDEIDGTVSAAMNTPPGRHHEGSPTWRPQLALLASGA